MTPRDQISGCFTFASRVDPDEAINALLDNDAAKIATLRAKRTNVLVIRDTWLAAYDAAKDDIERNAVMGLVRQDRAFSPIEHEIKVAEMRAKEV